MCPSQNSDHQKPSIIDAKYRALVDQINGSVYVLAFDGDQSLLFVSSKIQTLTGFSPHAWMETPDFWMSRIVPEDKKRVQLRRAAATEQKKPWVIEYRMATRDGTTIWIRDESTLVEDSRGNVLFYQGILRDITSRRAARKEFEIDEKRYTRLFEQSPVPIEIFTPDGTQTFVNAAWKKLWNVEEAPATGSFNVFENQQVKDMGLTDEIHAAFRGEVVDVAEAMFDPQKSGLEGEARYLHSKFYPIKDQHGNLDYVVVSHEDITQRKRAEMQLKNREFFLRKIIDMNPHFIFAKDRHGRFTLANKAVAGAFGTTSEQMIGKTDVELNRPAVDALRAQADDLEVVNSKKKKVVPEETMTDAQGITRHLQTTKIPILGKDNSVDQVLGISVDITNLKRAEQEKENLERQLLQAQKMESIGRLAGGIAHDFNNILTGIMGYAELLKMAYPDVGSPTGKAADVIFQGAGRASQLTKQLLGFARGGKFNPKPLNMNDMIRDAIKVSEHVFEKNIDVIFDLDPTIHAIEADESQINQVLTNIIINAKDAMPQGGTLTFRTETAHFSHDQSAHYRDSKPGPYIKTTIADSGKGMTSETRDRIFEPFFSTKPEDQGTGLGLATVYGIVKNHGGHIEVTSTVDVGTTFCVYFPTSEKTAEETKGIPEIVKGHAVILVVDDEEDVRSLIQRMLEDMGHRVLSAADGWTAENIYRSHWQEIDVVLLDMIMPGIDGRQTNRALRFINPDVKVLLTTGYAQDGKAAEILNEGPLGFIQKPFTIAELSKTIANILDHNSER